MTAYPFALYMYENAPSYVTYDLEHLLPLFPGLALDRFEVEDPYHMEGVMEDGWGHDSTYDLLGRLIKGSKGWKELIYYAHSDIWLEDTVSQISGPDGQSEEVNKREPQPETWDKMIKLRDGEGSGANVDMWYKNPTGADDGWEKVESTYEVKFINDEPRPAIKVRVRRGEGADCRQDGEGTHGSGYAQERGLYELFKEKTWEQIRDTLLLDGETDPTAHL